MPLGFAGDAIAFVEAGIEPLGTVGHTGLVEDAVNQFFIKNLRIGCSSKITITLAPYFPAIGHAMGYLLGRSFAAQGTIGLGYAGFTEIFLGQDIGGNLR